LYSTSCSSSVQNYFFIMESISKVQSEVSEYYGKTLQSSDDLKTNACCLAKPVPQLHKKILSQLHDEILSKFYGCGSPLPDELEGRVVLDLGCGTGRDVYLASALVGENGSVIGVDMTDEQLDVARKHQDYQTKQFGFSKSNVTFKKGIIEDLASGGIADSSVDVVISNCVINLSPNKEKVFSEIYRVLKDGGELYFSDIFADRRIPKELQADSVLWGECLSGAMYTEDFRRMLERVGFLDHRVLSQSIVTVNNKPLQEKLGNITFYSITIRAFKLSSLEDRCEDYGQVATYLGTSQGNPHCFILDNHHTFITDLPAAVCGNTADMLEKTRYGKHFKVTERKEHRGLFDCGGGPAVKSSGGCC
jgi:arsenite methyltransferase